MSELVSVIIPTYNRATVIERAINSVLNQTYKFFEIIVVDDNSTDHTKAIIDRYGDKIKYIKNDINLGPSKARNVGVEMASGSLIAFQDSDDEWHTDKLDEQVRHLATDNEYGMIYCAYKCIDNYYNIRVPAVKFSLSELEGNIFESLIEENKIGTPTMLIRREVLAKVGLFNEELKALEDWELALRISLHYKIGFVNKILVTAYSTLGGVNSIIDNKLEARILIARTYFKYVENKNCISSNVLEMINVIEGRDLIQKAKFKKLFVPDIISTDMEYDLISKAIQKKEKFRQNYEMSLKLMDLFFDPNPIHQFLREQLESDLIILGFGKIGYRLFQLLVKEGYKVKLIIDQNEGEFQSVPIINKNAIMGQTGMVIRTIPDFDNSLTIDLQKRNKFTIVDLMDI